MPDLIPFEFKNKPLTALKDEQDRPWFIASEVCTHLGLANVSKACERLERDEQDDITLSDVTGRLQERRIISEPGLYKLIMRSRKPEAKAFQRWVTHEVLPAIRKTGKYDVAINHHPDLKAMVQLIEGLAEARDIADAAKAEAQEAKALAHTAIEAQHFLTIREYVFLNHLEHQVTPSQQTAYGRWLAGYCLERGIPVRKIQVADRQYDAENGYHNATIDATLATWLTRREGQGVLIPFPTEGA